MSIPYLLFSLGGVAALVALNVMLFGFKTAKLATAQRVEAYLKQTLPAFRGRSMSLDAGHMAALAENDIDGTVHLVTVCGDAFVTRKLCKPLLRTVTREGDGLSLRLADLTLPDARLVFGDATTAALWQQKLSEAIR